MRLDPITDHSDELAPEDLARAREGALLTPPGPEPWAILYALLWLIGLLLAGMVAMARQFESPVWLLGWAGGFAVAAAIARGQRVALGELLAGLLPRERILMGLLFGAIFLAPVLRDGAVVLLDGFLWVAPFMLLVAVTAQRARVFLAWTMAGAWMAALPIAHEPSALALGLGFGVAWLAALGAIHVAWTAEPHGLTGWWPAYRLAAGVARVLPGALLAGVTAWLLWPVGGLHPHVPFAGIALPSPRPGQAQPLDPIDMVRLVWSSILALVMIIALMWFVLAMRRLLSRRGGTAAPAATLPGQSVRMEYRAAPPPPMRPVLGGRRGRIVELWGRWADALGREVAIRRDGETAREFAGRLARNTPEAEPDAAMTELLERAHYAPAEPEEADTERMRRMVSEELSRQSLRRQVPIEPIE